jgi:uncharacterized membrane protein
MQKPAYCIVAANPLSFLWRVGALAGLLMVLVMPPFQGPDEFNHFFRAYQVSTGQWLGMRTPDQRLGGPLPFSLTAVAQPFRHLPFRPEGRITPHTTLAALRIPLYPAQQAFTDFANTAIYAPTAYLPQAMVMAPLRWAGVNPLVLLYIGRISGLLWWLGCCHVAIRLWPRGGYLLMALALLPSALALHATLTADTVTNGCCFVLLALLLRLAEPECLPDRRVGVAIAVLAIAIAGHKIVYAPLVGLIGLGWGQTAKRRFIAGMAVVLTFGCGVAIAGWNQVTRALFIPYDAYHVNYRNTQQLNEGVDPAAQCRYIGREPLAFGRTLVVSFLKTAPSATMHYIGKFGWEKNYQPWPLVAVLLAGLLALAGSIPGGGAVFDGWQRALLAGCVVAMSIALGVVMYALWNPVGASFIHNLGGKYFIPIAPLMWLAIIHGRWAQWQMRIAICCQMMLLLALGQMIGQMVFRYYGG